MPRISVARSITCARFSRPAENFTPSTAVGIEGNVLSTAFGFSPASYGVSQSSFAAAALITAANRRLNTLAAPNNLGYMYVGSNASVTAWSLPHFYVAR